MVLALSACNGVVPAHHAVPEGMSSQAMVEGFAEGIRFWADEAPKDFDKVAAAQLEQFRENNAEYYAEHGEYPPLSYLAISGGAYDGAFGAGLLTGWSKKGDRPNFALVTGVSTGALIAPFVFVGPKYDGQLKSLFTETASENIFTVSVWKVLGGITGGLAVTDSSPLAKKIQEVITPEVLAEVATEYKKGKQLLIGTTNLEAQRGVIWDVGKIAASGNPQSLKLVHQIMLASASVPGLFQPVFIDVTVAGKEYNEIHADGGIISQVFAYPMRVNRSIIDNMKKINLRRDLYIVRNSKITPEYKVIKPGVFSLTVRSLETLIKNQSLGDLYRLYMSTERDDVNYHLATIPGDFQADLGQLFDPVYMGKLYELGFATGQSANMWMAYPPGAVYAEVEKSDALKRRKISRVKKK